MAVPPTPVPSGYDRIFEDVKKDIPGVPDAILRQEIFRVMDDFTQHTNIWQEHVPVTILPNVTTYTLVIADGKPNRLMTVYNVNPDGSIAGIWPNGPAFMRVPGELQLTRKPTSGGNVVAVVAKRTWNLSTMNYPVIDDWIPEKYADALGRGVMARLQFSPNKPWSNPMLAQPNQRAYISGRSEARVNNEHANTFDAQNWRFPQGWSTISRKAWV